MPEFVAFKKSPHFPRSFTGLGLGGGWPWPDGAPGPRPAGRGGGRPASLPARTPPPPPGRPNSTPREGGADKGSGAACSAPDRLRHHALGLDVGTLRTVGISGLAAPGE